MKSYDFCMMKTSKII